MVGSTQAEDDRIVASHDLAAAVAFGVVLEATDSPDRSSAVSCSICLDVVINDGERSCAKLKCGHRFHLDCIGSAFNMKGSMQCPNCRMVEKGHWLYANDAAQAVPEYSVDDWIPGQEPYELAFPRLPLRVHWCPFGGLAQYRSVLEDVDPPSAMYQGLPEHAMFAEHSAASTSSHSYATHIGQLPLPNAIDSLEEPLFNHHWSATHGEIPVPHAFPAIDFQYQSWIHHPVPTNGHINGVDQSPNPASVLGPLNDETLTRSTSSTHDLPHGQVSNTRALGQYLPSVVPLPMGRSHERIIQLGPPPVLLQSGSASVIPPPMQHNRQYYFDQRLSVVPAPPSHPDQNGAYYVMNPPAVHNPHELPHPVPSSHMNPWDRFPASLPDGIDLNWPSLQESVGRLESGNTRPVNVWQRHRS